MGVSAHHSTITSPLLRLPNPRSQTRDLAKIYTTCNMLLAFIPAFSEPQSHWPRESFPARPQPIRGRGARGGSCPSGNPLSRRAGSASSFTTIYHLIILINRVVVASTSRIQRNPILGSPSPSSSAQRSAIIEEATHNTATASTQHSASSSPTKDLNCL